VHVKRFFTLFITLALAPNSNLPRELPINVRNAAMIFNDTSHYGLYDVREWEALTPPGNGWVLLEPDSKPYAVSMFHQLHCLNSMRYDLTQSKIGKYPTEENLAHAHHCYNYHRQNLLCGLDLTLSSTGYGLGDTAHVCRDWAQIREYLEENYKKFYMYFPY
jgi:hypothetical protein